MAALEDIHAVLAGEGGLLADALLAAPEAGASAELGARAAAGPRAASDPAAYAFVVEAIHEGHLLHDGRSRLLDQSDPDLALLAGDRLYALGLERLSALGDLAAVAELAEVISLCAQARAQARPALAAAAWDAGVAAVGWGADDALRAARDAARAGAPGAEDALRAAARQLCRDVAPGR
ncbi:MAG: hypothetical protein ACXVFN_10420 [Solirubrobacteraceae bacterium]